MTRPSIVDTEHAGVPSPRSAAQAREKTVRRRSSQTVFGLPLVDIALGPDPLRGEKRGHAKGIIAIGDRSQGLVALGGRARGFIAMGGVARWVVAMGGLAVGAIAVG